MAEFLPNTYEALRAAGQLSSYLHPDYRDRKPEWDLLRDCLIGERKIKERGTDYLPPLDTNIGTDYDTYKDRASFFNMTARTLNGLVGTAFRKPPKVDNVAKEDLLNVTLDGVGFPLYCKKLAYELIGMGRIGVLVDVPQDGKGQPYLVEYVAENILSWHVSVINGREVLTYALLREIIDNSLMLNETSEIVANTTGNSYALTARYRVLLLENGVYKQRVYEPSSTDNSANPTFVGGSYTEIIPEKNGQTFDYIPFKIFGPLSPTPEMQKSPLIDIAYLNISHYRTSAQLEHGRYNTALPVYWVTTNTPGDQSEYALGPSVVWELGPESKAGILEYFGAGLKALVDGLAEKEEHIAQLGGRMMGIRPPAQSDNPDTLRMKQQSEVSILLNVVHSLSDGMTDVLKWYLDWQRKPTDGVQVRLNKDFAMSIDAREMRAIVVLYQSGILPVGELFRVLQNADFLNEDMTEDEFVVMLKDLENFPNQPSVEAQSEGFANATDRMNYAIQSRAADLAETAQTAQQDQFTQQLKNDRMLSQNNAGNQGFTSAKRTAQFQSAAKTPKAQPSKPPTTNG